MQAVLLSTAESVSAHLDVARASFLRVTLGSDFLRRVFCNRAHRLLFLFTLALIFNLTASVLFPLWVLILGPMVYGVPHIFASMRYVHYAVADVDQIKETRLRLNTFRFLTAVWTLVTVFRLLTDTRFGYSALAGQNPMLPELISLGVTFAGCAYLYRKSLLRVTLGFLLLAPFLWAAWVLPLATTGALILIHNVIGYLYWFQSAKTLQEKKTALYCVSLFVIANALIFTGAFDFAYKAFSPAGQLRWANLEYSELGKLIAPWSESYVTWFHCVVAYAFGQSLHYFVWLKAIPDQNHHHDVPTSFKQSYKLMLSDFGVSLGKWVIAGCLASVAVWLFMRMPEARVVYFALAAYHGYLEIAGLSLSALKKWA